MEKKKTGGNSSLQKLYMSLLLAIIALVSVSAATIAWFTIADHTKLQSIGVEVTSGTAIRFDLDPHPGVEMYKRTLKFGEIADRIYLDLGYDLRQTPLNPVTTSDGVHFTRRNGSAVSPDSGDYLEFTLHFIATQDVLVHLSSANSAGQEDGTLISSETQPTLPGAMRISFTADGKTVIFNQSLGNRTVLENGALTFGLPDGKNMVYTGVNTLFDLKQEVDKPVVVRVWIEGTDPACNNTLQGADYSIRLRFEATGADNELIEEL